MADNPSSNHQMIVTFPGGRRVNAAVEGFEIATDQSPANGGDGSAPEPYTLFLASLATCAGVYVSGFCAKRGIDTADLRISAGWQRDDRGRLATMTLDIHVPPSVPAKYHDALIRAAGQCSVKKTMDAPPEFVIRTIEQDG